jgi:hypothetical protein
MPPMGRCECGFSHDDVAVRAIAERLPLVVDDQWRRSCVYNYPEPMKRSLEWVGRHTLHEAIHHLVDVRRLLGREADRQPT